MSVARGGEKRERASLLITVLMTPALSSASRKHRGLSRSETSLLAMLPERLRSKQRWLARSPPQPSTTLASTLERRSNARPRPPAVLHPFTLMGPLIPSAALSSFSHAWSRTGTPASSRQDAEGQRRGVRSCWNSANEAFEGVYAKLTLRARG